MAAFAATILVFAFVPDARAAGTARLFVSASHPSATGSGASWSDPYKYLQDALAAAPAALAAGATDVEIWVAKGNYRADQDAAHPAGTNVRTVSFQLANDVRIYGHFAGTEALLSERPLWNPALASVLDGDIGVPGVATDNTIHVVNASATTADATTRGVLDGFTIRAGFAETAADPRGAGIRCGPGFVVLANLLVSDCRALDGGACSITNHGDVDLVHCLFLQNAANRFGGALFVSTSEARAFGCVFGGNTAKIGGGAVYVKGLFLGAPSQWLPAFGTFAHCDFVQNVCGPSPTQGGGAFFVDQAFLTIGNSIVYGNAAPAPWGPSGAVGTQGTANLTACDLQGRASGVANAGTLNLDATDFDADPLFLGPSNLHPSVLSPVIGKGAPLTWPDVADLDHDGDVSEAVPYDLDGVPRACGTPDLGVYEWNAAGFPYGTGCAGSGGVVPTVFVAGCAAPGATLEVRIGSGLGGAPVLVLFGAQPGSAPLGGGCTQLVGQLFGANAMLMLGGVGPGAGTAQFTGILPPVAVVGQAIHVQAFVNDPAQPGIPVASNAFRVVTQ